MQRRVPDFFSGATLRLFKGYHAPPQGVWGGGPKAPRMVAKFHFLKGFKVL